MCGVVHNLSTHFFLVCPTKVQLNGQAGTRYATMGRGCDIPRTLQSGDHGASSHVDIVPAQKMLTWLERAQCDVEPRHRRPRPWHQMVSLSFMNRSDGHTRPLSAHSCSGREGLGGHKYTTRHFSISQKTDQSLGGLSSLVKYKTIYHMTNSEVYAPSRGTGCPRPRRHV